MKKLLMMRAIERVALARKRHALESLDESSMLRISRIEGVPGGLCSSQQMYQYSCSDDGVCA